MEADIFALISPKYLTQKLNQISIIIKISIILDKDNRRRRSPAKNTP